MVGRASWTSPDGRIVWSTRLGNNEHEYDTDNPILRGSQPVDEKANLTDAFTREACDFISRHRTQPWFLHLAYNAVHSPMQGADAYMARFAHIADIHRPASSPRCSRISMTAWADVLAQLRESGVEKTRSWFS